MINNISGSTIPKSSNRSSSRAMKHSNKSNPKSSTQGSGRKTSEERIKECYCHNSFSHSAKNQSARPQFDKHKNSVHS